MREWENERRKLDEGWMDGIMNGAEKPGRVRKRSNADPRREGCAANTFTILV